MGIDLGTATVFIGADLTRLSRGIDGAKLLMAGLGAAAADAAGAALKMAGDFQQQNTMLATSAGEQLRNLKMISDGVLKASVDTGTSTTQLEAGMYTIESSGQHGAKALQSLIDAAKGAKAENASLGDVANAETTIMTDYAKAHITSAQAINDLIATVSRGKTHLQDLAVAMSTILPTSNAVGVSLYDTSGAMATMTAEGTNAASAATYLRQLLIALEAPAKKGATALKEIGLSTADVSNEMKISLPDTLAMIEDHLKAKFPEGSAKYIEALKNIAGGSRQMQGILELTGTHLQAFKDNVDQITASVKQGGTQISGWTEVQKNFNFQMDKAHAQLDAVAIKIGTDLMPIVSAFISQDVMPAIANFQEWATHTTGLHDTFVTLIGALGNAVHGIETLATDTAALVNWFAQGGVQGALLKDVLIGVGVAVATVKIAALAGDLEKLATSTIPQALIKYGLLTAATTAQATATGAAATQLTLWTGEAVPATAATNTLATAEAGAATAGGSVAASFTAMLGPIALATAAVLGAKTAWDAYVQSLPAPVQDLPGVKDGLLAPPFQDIQNANDAAALQKRQEDLQKIKQEQDAINLAWKDMNDLYDKFANGHHQLGVLDGIMTVDTKVMDLKTHIDDLGNGVYLDDNMKPTVFHAISQQAETADNKVRILKSHLDDLVNEFDAYNSQIGFSGGKFTANPDTYQRHASRDDTTAQGGPGAIITSNRGVAHHATGGVIPPGQYGIVNDEPGAKSGELMYGGSSGISVLPAGPTAAALGGGARQPVEIHIHIGNREVASYMVDDVMNLAVKKIRTVAGSRR